MRTVTTCLLTATVFFAGGLAAHLLWYTIPTAEASVSVRDDFIALTAQDRSGAEQLFVIDPKQRILLAYEMKHDGLALIATRRLEYDFKVVSYRDASKKGLTYHDLKQRFTSSPRRDEKKK